MDVPIIWAGKTAGSLRRRIPAIKAAEILLEA
jgi:hypothetical protein